MPPMLDAIKKMLGGTEGRRFLREINPLVRTINSWEADIEKLTDDELKHKTTEFRARLHEGASLDDILPEAFAVVRETTRRILGQRHYDVQLMGGIALHRGNIAEMRTGEGKTHMGTLPTYVNALTGKGVHVVTVNDYLSRRDATWMGQIFAFHGLSIGVINSDGSYLYDIEHTTEQANEKAKNDEHEEHDELAYKVSHEFLRPCTRKEAYAADITYGTNNEFGFDYLRDNIEHKKENLRQREFHYAIVDEIDSILIDESRTPLIISAPAQESEDLYHQFADVARKLVREDDFTVDEKLKAVQLTDAGIEKAEKLLGLENIYTEKGIKYVHHLETAVRAKALFEKDQQYVVRDDQVVIVDEFTGRLQPGRRWSEGLHQAIEAKEGVRVQRESRTFASITFQNYFKMYQKLAGMTGTALTSSEEFYSVYKLDVIPIPTHRDVARIDQNDFIFQTEKGKFKAIAKKVKELHEKGQPVLIGTVSIEKNEALSEYLKREGVPHELLNAKNHESEGEIIAQAGQKGRVTIATNMAGRGVDIKLGGNPATDEEYETVKSVGGLYVLGTERHEARRIDNQLRGRSGRQGDPGEPQFFVSLEDTLMRVFATGMVKDMMGKLNIPEDEPIQNSIITKSLEKAQTSIEGFNFDARKRVLSYDNVLNVQRQTVYEKRRRILLGEDTDIESYLEEISADNEEAREGIRAKREELGDELFFTAVRRMCLQSIDLFWMEHLETMEYVRSSVNLRAYGQRDPLIEYRKEGLRLFKELEFSIEDQILRSIPTIVVNPNAYAMEQQKLKETHAEARLIGGTTSASTSDTSNTSSEPVINEEKIGRNEMVTVSNGSETKTIKYKKAENLLTQGWVIVK